MKILRLPAVCFLIFLTQAFVAFATERTVHVDFPGFNSQKDAVFMEGAETYAAGGAPLLPVWPVRILLAPGSDLSNITVNVRMLEVKKLQLPGEIAPAPRQQPIGLKAAPAGPLKNSSIYGRDALYPASDYRIEGIEISHGYPILLLQLYPLRWNPQRHKIQVASGAKIRVRLTDESAGSQPKARTFRASARDLEEVALLLDNPRDLGRFPAPKSGRATDWEYLIVTGNSMISTFQTLADHRAATDGMTTHIESMEDILSGTSGRDDAEKLRNFIIDAYTNHGTRYLVLGGDADIVPERGCYGRGEVSYTDNNIPTDFYFGALDGDWNADGDGIFGEPEDNVDLFAEVAVGRISAGNATEAGRQISKIIAYESWAAAPNTTLLLGENADSTPTWGGDMLDYLYLQMSGIPRETLYDRDGSWSGSTLINNYLNSNSLNTINHMGHANESTVMKMGTSDASGLSNTSPFFIYSQGCYAGAFDDSDCMAEYFTVKGNGGTHAVIMNSRYGWYTPASVFGSSNLFQREFLQAVYEEGTPRLGDANNRSKHNLAGLAEVYGSMRWCFFDITLFGDPATPIHWQCTATKLHVQPEMPADDFHVMQGDSFLLKAAVTTDCAGAPPGSLRATVEVQFNNGDSSLELRDDGVAPDAVAHDGHYTGLWVPGNIGAVELNFHALSAGLDEGLATLNGEIVPWTHYTRLIGTNPWIDTSAGTVLSASSLLGTDDDGGWILDIGFPFQFYGVNYTDMMVGTNGLIQMEHKSNYSSTEESFPLPFDGDDNGIIAPWWCDLDPGSTGIIRIFREGTSPNRQLTIEWHNVKHFDSSGAATFQVTLIESTNEIIFRYQNTDFGDADFNHGADASIGIEGPNGIHGLQLLYHEASLNDGDSFILSPISSTGQLFFDHPVYACNGTPAVTVMDSDLGSQSSLNVHVNSDTESELLMVALAPGADPRIFEGGFSLAEGTPASDAFLQVSDGDTITLYYDDAQPAAQRTAEARIDCSPPLLSDLALSEVGAHSAIVSWTTDEPADSSVISTPGENTASDGAALSQHRILLENLNSCTSYTVNASSTDLAGNKASLGPSDSFTTLDATAAVDDDAENGEGSWTIQTSIDPGTGTNWSIVSDAQASSPSHSWFSSDESSAKDDLLIGGPWTLGSGQTLLSFKHHFDFENGWDGGILEISTDGTNYDEVVDAGATFLQGEYTGSMYSSTGTPLSGLDAFTGNSGGLVESILDLSAFASSTIHLRFHLACDASASEQGWWIDDILLETTGPCSTPAAIFSDGFESGTTGDWSWAPLTS